MKFFQRKPSCSLEPLKEVPSMYKISKQLKINIDPCFLKPGINCPKI